VVNEMYLVRYRCMFRDWWYDDIETDDLNVAVTRARQVFVARSTPVIVVSSGHLIWASAPL